MKRILLVLALISSSMGFCDGLKYEVINKSNQNINFELYRQGSKLLNSSQLRPDQSIKGKTGSYISFVNPKYGTMSYSPYAIEKITVVVNGKCYYHQFGNTKIHKYIQFHIEDNKPYLKVRNYIGTNRITEAGGTRARLWPVKCLNQSQKSEIKKLKASGAQVSTIKEKRRANKEQRRNAKNK